MDKIIRAGAAMLLGILLPWLLQLWDRQRLRRRHKDAPWTHASWGAALYAFGPFSMLGWSHLTRPRPWRWLWGPAYTTLLLIPLMALNDDGAPGSERLEEGAGVCAAVFIASVILLLVIDTIVTAWRRLCGGPA
ncbi:MAG TPA: hypothetical protein ENK23_03235, partial [Sorangium sp.]|nr:hypothetical protein [Sorangium sp.]